ncbi:Heat shock protein GrpE [Moraxella catarrhalis]|nr:Heat shock protein GrpE [Moraxella catarrhalis]
MTTSNGSLHDRTGRLEILVYPKSVYTLLHDRTGRLETKTPLCRLSSFSSRPHRSLRKASNDTVLLGNSSRPHRSLRNRNLSSLESLVPSRPHRSLRKKSS